VLYLLTAGFVLVVAAMFTLQNIEPVSVKFLFWNLQTSLALALAGAFFLGVLSAAMISLAARMKGKFVRQ